MNKRTGKQNICCLLSKLVFAKLIDDALKCADLENRKRRKHKKVHATSGTFFTDMSPTAKMQTGTHALTLRIEYIEHMFKV